MPLTSGTKLGPYEIQSPLGAGGMGEVYRARDTRLDRAVAIKVIANHLSGDPVRRQRFEREAKAISALQHPNICTLYDVGHQDGTDYLVMEYLDGETLARRLDRGALPIEQTLRYGIEVADALDTAHRRGIVHRDLKPGNIMVTAHGECKVLDFGLAQLDEEASGADDAETVTRQEVLTSPGMALGTVAYMSPEQVRGEDLDARTDIFSLGTVLYEMASGRLPFAGKTSGLVFKAILDGTFSAPTSLNPALPEQFDEIVSKALEKDRDLRYQSAADLRTDLKRVKRDTESAKHAPAARTEATRRETSRWTWSGWTWAQWAAVAAVAAVVAGAGFGAWWYGRRTQAPPSLVERQITFNAPENYVSNQAISPDGKYLAYSDSSGLHLRVIASGEEHNLPEPTAGTLSEIAWFPDGNTLLLSTAEESVAETVWALSIFGGNASKLRSGIGGVGADAVSPDGSQVVFEKKPSGDEIWLMDAHGENPRLLLADKDHRVSSPAWSPDGRYVVYLSLDRTNESRFGGKVEVWDIQRGSATEIVSDPNLADNALLWNRNWQVIFALSEPIDVGQSRNFGLWKIDVDRATGRASGKAARITKWAGYDTDDMSATQDSKILSALKTGKSMDIYIGTLAANGSRLEKTQRLTFQHGIDLPASWTSDSSAILLSSNRNGAFNIFRQNIHQQTAERMFGSADTNAAGGSITPDGAWTLYWSLPKGESANGTGAMRLMRAPVSGGSPEVVLETKLEADVNARCPSRPKSSCILSEGKAKELSFYELDPLHGKGREVARCAIGTRRYGWDISPDGSKIAVASSLGTFIRTIELATGSVRDVPVPADWLPQSVGWAADGKALFVTVYTPKAFLLGQVDLAGHAHVLLDKGTGQWLTQVVASPDGRSVAFGAQTWDSNVWLLENF